MAHYAKVIDGVVVQVIVADQDFIAMLPQEPNAEWLQTSYNTRGGVHYDSETGQPDGKPAFRKNYAGVGYIYDDERDAFIASQPYPSWTLDDYSCLWVAPTPRPDEDTPYQWDEENLKWVEITMSGPN